MTLLERCAAFNAAYAKWPASHLQLVSESGRPVIYGRWLIGNDYRNKTRYYGAYPAGYLDRVMALFPDADGGVLHAFSGSLPKGPYVRLDVNIAVGSDVVGSVYNAPKLFDPTFCDPFNLILADPPYSSADAEKYGTVGVDRRRAMAALAQVARVGGHLVWLDTCWPMHSKRQWRTVGRIALTRSTNHRLRDITIFERQAA